MTSTTVVGSLFTVSQAAPHSTTLLRSSLPSLSFANCQPFAPPLQALVSCEKQVGMPPFWLYCTLISELPPVGVWNSQPSASPLILPSESRKTLAKSESLLRS